MLICEQQNIAHSRLFNNTILACIVILSLSGCGGGGQGTTPPASGGNELVSPTLGAAVDSDKNVAPSIEAISLGCDLVLDSIAISGGTTTSFTLVVDDESPLTMVYSIASDDESIALASVDIDGVFSLQGLEPGTTTMPVKVTDDQGISDEILLNILVES